MKMQMKWNRVRVYESKDWETDVEEEYKEEHKGEEKRGEREIEKWEE